jgi:hypothetical protein
MPDSTATLSAAILRLAGEVGYATLDWLAAGPAGATAELDQHIAAVRVDLERCSQTRAGGGRAGAGRQPRDMPRAGVPDVPFAATALHAEPTVPLQLLLHYACGFVEAAVRDDWWPGDIASGDVDFACLRLAALCRLISQAEADAELHPDLRNFA